MSVESRRLPRIWRALIFATALTGGGVAGAQTADPARAAFEQGIAAMRAGRSADAVTSFTASYGLRPVPVALYNLGLAHRAAGNRREAWIAFARYLNGVDAGADPERLAAVRAEMDALRGQMGLLRFAGEPAGTELSVDGRAVSFGSPELMVDPGAHEVSATAPGHRPGRFRAEVARGGATTVAVTLAPLGSAALDPRVAPDPPREGTTSRRGWVVPVVVVSAVAVAAAVTLGVYFATAGGVEAPPSTTGWTVQSLTSW